MFFENYYCYFNLVFFLCFLGKKKLLRTKRVIYVFFDFFVFENIKQFLKTITKKTNYSHSHPILQNIFCAQNDKNCEFRK